MNFTDASSSCSGDEQVCIDSRPDQFPLSFSSSLFSLLFFSFLPLLFSLTLTFSHSHLHLFLLTLSPSYTLSFFSPSPLSLHACLSFLSHSSLFGEFPMFFKGCILRLQIRHVWCDRSLSNGLLSCFPGPMRYR